MPRCRRDQTKFAQFLLAIIVVESLLVYLAMTWEHETAQSIAEQKRQKLQWKRETFTRRVDAIKGRKPSVTSSTNMKGKKFWSDLGFSHQRTKKQLRDKREALEMRLEHSDFQQEVIGIVDPLVSFNGKLSLNGDEIGPQSSDSSHSDSGEGYKVLPNLHGMFNDRGAHGENLVLRNERVDNSVTEKSKISGFLSFLRKRNDKSWNSKLRNELYELRGSML